MRGSIPGTRCTPSSTIDHPSSSARSIEALELDALLAVFSEILLDPLRELVGPPDRDAHGDESPRHQTLRVRVLAAAERQRLRMAGMAHARTPAGTSPRIAASSPGATTS